MAFKIFTKGNYFYIQTPLGFEYRGHKKDIKVISNEEKTVFSFYGFISNSKENRYNAENINISDMTNADDVPFTLDAFETFYTENTGNFNSGGISQEVQSITGADINKVTYIANRNTIGVFEPRFTNPLGLANKTGEFNIANGGGLIASTSGIEASGVMNLPVDVDFTKPFRFAALVEYGGGEETAHVVFNNSNNGRSSVDFSINDAVSTNLGYTTIFNRIFNTTLVVGEKYWFSIIGDGNIVTISVLPEIRKGLKSYSSYEDQTNADYYKTYPIDFEEGGNQTFNGINQIIISNSSAVTKVLGVMFSQSDKFLTENDIRFRPPGIFNTTILSDTTPIIRLPRNYNGHDAIDLVLWNHSNNSAGEDGCTTDDVDFGNAAAHLVESGYIVATMLGTSTVNGYATPQASNWGAYDGLKYRYELIKWIMENLPNIRNIYSVGISMGLQNSLGLQKTYPNLIKAVVGISGVTNLTDSYENRGFSGTLDLAYNVNLSDALQDQDTNLRPSIFTNIPIKLWHGANDTLIPELENADLFKTNVEATGGSVEVISIIGAGHKDNVGLFDGNGIANFFSTNS